MAKIGVFAKLGPVNPVSRLQQECKPHGRECR